MTTPTLMLGFVLATLLGALAHLIFGGDARRLAAFLIAGWVGFVIGQIAATLFHWNFLNIGTLHVLPAVLSSIGLISTVLLFSARRFRRRASG